MWKMPVEFMNSTGILSTSDNVDYGNKKRTLNPFVTYNSTYVNFSWNAPTRGGFYVMSCCTNEGSLVEEEMNK